MLSWSQRRVLFGLFCVSTVALIVVEAYVVWAMVNRDLTIGKMAASLLSAGLLGGCGVIFLSLVRATFLQRELVPTSRLHRLATDRSGITEDALRNNTRSFDTRKALVTTTLRFVEESLNGWIPGSHLELCVFIDSEQPFLFGYFDSNHDSVARSMSIRLDNPTFYIDERYEVVKLLQNPTSQPRVISDTHDRASEYKFTTKEQRKQIRSSILLSVDLVRPIALVISSNSANAFPESDPKLLSFIRYAGEIIRSDLIDGGFVDHVRDFRPELFPDVTALPASNAAIVTVA